MGTTPRTKARVVAIVHVFSGKDLKDVRSYDCYTQKGIDRIMMVNTVYNRTLMLLVDDMWKTLIYLPHDMIPITKF